MNVNKPNNLFKVYGNNYNLTEVQVKKNNDLAPLKQARQQQKLPEGMIQSLKEWEHSEELEKNKSARWDLSKLPLKFYVSQGKNIPGFKPEFEQVIDSAFLEWSRASLAKIRFSKSLTESQSDIIIKWAETVVLGREFEAGHNNLKVIGDKIIKAEISIVVYPVFDKLSNNFDRTERVRRTFLHEIGHALGLTHSTNPKDMMFHQGINNKAISENDSQALQDLYSNPKVNEFSV